MPLPAPNTAWPPAPYGPVLARVTEHDAWWSGDPDALSKAYANATTGRPATTTRPGQLAGGVVGAVSRWWWGSPLGTDQRARRHMPLPADIAETSAALLFGDPPTFKVAGDDLSRPLLEGVDALLNVPAVHSQLVEAAESAAALSGCGLRIAWDEDVADRAFVDVVDADHVLPTFRWGRLVGVTFVTVLPAPDGGTSSVWRHLERHEWEQGRAVIRHGLYEGDHGNLGRRMPYGDHPGTGYLAVEAAEGRLVEDTIDRGIRTGLTASYVPNVRPQRGPWRNVDQLRELGRSDFQGLEPLFDGLDETWSSLMRDVDLGKARITVPDYMLDDLGPGKGTRWDPDRAVYVGVRADPRDSSGGVATDLHSSQFQIRVDEHLAVADALTRQAVKAAGYSPLTFGLPDETAATATEWQGRESASWQTVRAKRRHWGNALGDLLRTLVEVDSVVFPRGGPLLLEDPVVVEWPARSEPMSVVAQTVSMLRQAQAVSTRQAVQLVHQDWTDEQVDDEAAAIRDELGMAVPDLLAGDDDDTADATTGDAGDGGDDQGPVE